MSDESSAQPVTTEPVAESTAPVTSAVASETAIPEPDAKVDNGSADAPEPAADSAEAPATDEPPAPEPEAKADESVPAADDAAKEVTDADGAKSATTPNTKGRRKSAGPADAKGKALKKKQSKAKILHLDAKPGDHYLVKLKGYPIWPAIICDEEILPESLSTSRPVTARRSDGTYRDDYADGGKNVGDRTLPVMYLFTNEFGWVPNYDLIEYDPDNVPDLSKGRKDLYNAYLLAAEKNTLEYYKTLIQEFNAAQEAKKAEAAAKKAEKEAKKAKGKRKSTATIADEEGDVEMADIADATETPKPKSKKRKAAAVEDADAATPNTASAKKPMIKFTSKSNGTPKSAKKDDTPAKSKAKSKKSESTAPAEPQLSVEERRLKKEKEILFLRHKLQKGLLTRDQTPKPEEMTQMSEYITKLEGYAELEVAIIRATKINKVLKAIKKLEVIPREDEFRFKSRSDTLLAKWNKILESAGEAAAAPPTNGEAKAEAKSEEPEKTNGVKESEHDKAEPEKTEEKAPESVETTEPAEEQPVEEPVKTQEAPAVEASA